MYSTETTIEINDELKMLVGKYVRVLHEHMGVVTPHLDDIDMEQGVWRDTGNGMEVDETETTF